MTSINKLRLKKYLKEKNFGTLLSHCSFPNCVIDRLLDISIKDGSILTDSLFIDRFTTFDRIYRECSIDASNEKELNDYFKLVEIYLFITKRGHVSVDWSSLLISNSYNLFNDKKKTFQFLNRLIEVITKSDIDKHKLHKYVYKINEYLTESRKYYNDEVIYLSRLVSELEPILESTHLIDDLIKQDKKLAGIYDIDEERISKIEEVLNNFDKKTNTLNNKIDNLFSNIDDMEEYVDNYSAKIKKELLDCKKDILSEIKKALDDSMPNSNKKPKNKKKKVKASNKISDYSEQNDFLHHEAINLLGADFSLEEYSIFKRFYAANGTNILKKIIDNNHSFMVNFGFHLSHIGNFLECDFLSIINNIGIAIFANLNRSQFECIFVLLDNKALLDRMIQLLKLNPTFTVDYSKIIWLLKWFDVDFLANADEKLQNTFDITSKYDYDNLNRVLEINPNFRVYVEDFDIKITEKIGIKTVAFSDEKRQKTINMFDDKKCLNKLLQILEIDENFNLYEINFDLTCECYHDLYNLCLFYHSPNHIASQICEYDFLKRIDDIIVSSSVEEIMYFNDNHLFEKIVSLLCIEEYYKIFNTLSFEFKKKLLSFSDPFSVKLELFTLQDNLFKKKKQVTKALTKKLW